MNIFLFETQRYNWRALHSYMESQRLELVKEFKYLGFLWTNKMSLKPTIDRTRENIQKTFCKLRWMKSGRALSKNVLRRCFFAYKTSIAASSMVWISIHVRYIISSMNVFFLSFFLVLIMPLSSLLISFLFPFYLLFFFPSSSASSHFIHHKCYSMQLSLTTLLCLHLHVIILIKKMSMLIIFFLL